MVIKFIFRPQSLPFSFLSFPPRFFSRPLNFSLLSTSTTTAFAAVSSTLPYGPSLRKGYSPSPFPPTLQQCPSSEQESDSNLFDEDSFTRVFDLAALRVPSELCFALENRLRGHLLNWPRVRNIARVPGDEIDDELKKLFADCSSSNNLNTDNDPLVTLNRRIYGKADGDGELLSPVLYRDKLARTFNSRGFVNFRNLAKISRPKKVKKKEEERKETGKKGGVGRNEMAVVAVVEEEEEEGDVSGLLGDEFKGKSWRGSTRLLLLDETYANKGINEMPDAIKVSIFLQFGSL